MYRWLKCNVDRGMFSDELTVTVQDRSGGPIAVFVPKSAVDDQVGLVKVTTFRDYQGQTFAVLPDDHRTVVDVSEAEFQPKAVDLNAREA